VVETGDSVRGRAGESVGIGEGTISELMLLEGHSEKFRAINFRLWKINTLAIHTVAFSAFFRVS
jgi:hypothetical protein